MIADNLLRGTTVRLTGIAKEDLAALARWHDDAGFLRLLDATVAKPRSEAELTKWWEKQAEEQNGFHFAIRPLDGAEALGFVDLDGILWNHGVAWLAISIGERGNWGKGIGTEALGLALDYAFRELNLYRVQLTVFAYNDRAIALYERLGFQREGVYREFLHRDGQRYDMYLYGLLRREWEAGKQHARS